METISIIGLGYIGLPTSALIASKGLKVYGVDINDNVVNLVNQGKIHIVEPDLDKLVKKVVETKNFTASTVTKPCDVYLIVVPTPFNKNLTPDISYVENAIKKITPHLKSQDLIIIESTSPVGTTDKMKNLIFKERTDLIDDIYLAYCPERVLPGNILYELENNDRIVGGIDDKSSTKAKEFYELFVKGEIHKTNARTAEMCKLTENASRDVQIAFANELSIICEKADINVWELISLANKHPRVNILQPGCGVGGHCIAVDPYFIVSEFPQESKLIKNAREVNNFKPEWCISKIKMSIEVFKKNNNYQPNIAICGLSFKPNIDDLRESPALNIALKLKDQHPSHLIHFIEPNIESHPFLHIEELDSLRNQIDIYFILVGHDEFKNINSEQAKVISFVSL